MFNRVSLQKRQGITESDFEKYKKWYGIEFSAFTIFLFWISSDNFLPIDKNTRTYLISSGFMFTAPNDYKSYKELLERIDNYNNDEVTGYGYKGLFREIAHIAFNVINKGIQVGIESVQYRSLRRDLNSEINYPDLQEVTSNVNENQIEYNPGVNILNLGFKIIAIKPLRNCEKEFLNVLIPSKLYYFENAFTIKRGRIEFNEEELISLYDQKIGTTTLKINVTAVVGKNGSGKSSLVELFFRLINNISYAYKKELKTNDIKVEKGLAVSLYYVLSGKMFCITVQDADIKLQEYVYKTSGVFEKKGNPRKFEFEDFENWFYTIAVNYSHYALNNNNIGEWIKELFHKNDAYQAPLVINPMRREGNIDINVENGLVKSRLLANLFSLTDDEDGIGIRQITESQKTYQIYFDIIPDKNKVLFKYETSGGKEIKVPFEKLKTRKSYIYAKVKKIFALPQITKRQKYYASDEARKYIIRKLVSISLTYPNYHGFFNSRLNQFNEKSFERYLGLLKNDTSHITYKLKQAINYLKHPLLLSRAERFKIDINKYSEKLSNFLTKEEGNRIIELIPPPIFKPRIELIDKKKNKSDFDKLSSGEKQLVYSANSIFYNIQNLDSVSRTEKGLLKYNNITLLLDEIELYYHPEMQRQYVAFLLRMLGKLSLVNIEAINICLVTHSPYILSDIPDAYILRLVDGKPKVDENLKTFGANIHDLLKNDFFLQNGPVGEFAKKQIEVVAEKLYDKEKDILAEKESIQKIISIVGEPLIEKRLQEMFNERFKSVIEIDQEIDFLIKLKERKIEKDKS